MSSEKRSTKNSFILFVTLMFVYIVLFEFILPINKILPKPTLLVESFLHIWKDYNLFFAFTTTTTIIYVSLILSYAALYVGAAQLFKLFVEMEGTVLSFRLFRYLPAFFFAVLFNFWFADSLFAEFLFATLAAIFLASQKLFEESKKVNEEYILVARNLDLTPGDIYEKVYWKFTQPSLIKYYERIHYLLWVLVLIFEFIGNLHGFGFIYRTALSYNDFTALFTLAIMISLLIWFGSFVIRWIDKEIIFWNA